MLLYRPFYICCVPPFYFPLPYIHIIIVIYTLVHFHAFIMMLLFPFLIFDSVDKQCLKAFDMHKYSESKNNSIRARAFEMYFETTHVKPL